MNNEPVAWMLLGLEDRKPKLINLQVIDHLEGTWIPLYTHPVELTDEEIYEVLWKHFPISDKEANANFITVVTHCIRVALRKAQEK